MSESTFRAVVAGVLVAALALAIVSVVFVATARTPAPNMPTPTTTAPTATPATPAATPSPFVFGDVGVVGVGLVPRGGRSAAVLAFRFLEPSPAAIPDGPGSFLLTITDHGGDGTTVAFTGSPTIVAPGSLGTQASLVANNVLRIDIRGADTLNIELLTVSGLGISASNAAALGSIQLTAGGFSGALAAGIAQPTLPSPGTVVAGP